jgi:hypothetical protein
MSDAMLSALDGFERALLDAMAGLSGELAAIRAQVADAHVVRRDRSPEAWTTYLCVAAGTPRLADGELSLTARVTLDGGVEASAELAVHNGWLDSLVVSGPIPDEPRITHVAADR